MNKKLTENLSPGHTTCAGCPIPIVIRTVLGAINYPKVVTNATGCMEVTTTIYPNTSWKVPYIHSAFENAGATVSGMETAYRALQKNALNKNQGEIKFVAFGGDGGTYDIGLQSLSGALERGHDFLYVCYDNGAYMNTGNQRSGATPLGADTETTPWGKDSFGKNNWKKDMMAIVSAHNIPYLATANIAFLQDLKMKVKKAMEYDGPKFLLVFSPCPSLWKFNSSQTIEIAKLATETGFWPLYEIENNRYQINYIPKEKIGIEEFYRSQGRFSHLFKRKDVDDVIDAIQRDVDANWKKLERLSSF